MKRLLCLMSVALLLTGCGGNPEDPAQTQPSVKTVYVHKSITRTQGQTVGRTDYIYNDENLLTDVIVSDAEGSELQRYLVACDENGNAYYYMLFIKICQLLLKRILQGGL